jgi:hypothetical protein
MCSNRYSIALRTTTELGGRPRTSRFCDLREQDTAERWRTTAASAFVLVAAVVVTGTAWLIVAGLIGHGIKDVGSTAPASSLAPAGGRRCGATAEFVAAGLIAAAIVAGVPFLT